MSYAEPEVVLVHREEPKRDQYGRVTNATPIKTRVPGAIVAPRKTEEITNEGREAVPIGKTVFFPAGWVVDRRDLIEIDSVIYEVEGEPAEWGNPFTGTDFGVEVAVKRVEG